MVFLFSKYSWRIHILLEVVAWKCYAGNIRSTYAKRCDCNVSSRTIYLRDISMPVCWTVQGGFIGKFDRVARRRTESTTQRSLQKKNAREIGKTRRRVREGGEPRSVEVYKRVRDGTTFILTNHYFHSSYSRYWCGYVAFPIYVPDGTIIKMTSWKREGQGPWWREEASAMWPAPASTSISHRCSKHHKSWKTVNPRRSFISASLWPNSFQRC